VINWFILTFYTYTVLTRATDGNVEDTFIPMILFAFCVFAMVICFFFLAAVFGFGMLAQHLILMFWKG